MPKHISLKQLQNVRKHRYILQKLSSVSAPKRKQMLLSAPIQLFNVFKTLCSLVSNGRLSLGKAKNYKNFADKVSRSKVAHIKGNVKQNGGAIGSIIAGVLPFLSPLLSRLFK